MKKRASLRSSKERSCSYSHADQIYYSIIGDNVNTSDFHTGDILGKVMMDPGDSLNETKGITKHRLANDKKDADDQN